jgi:Xaa-Pro aminopeptidase
LKITKAEFTRRRKKLMSMMDKNSIAIIPGAREVTRSRDTEYPFRQNSDLFYLTGFEEPDAVLVLLPGRRQGQMILFCRERDPDMELWNGYRLGPEGAIAYLGLDDAFPIDDLDEILPGLMEGTHRIYYSMGHDDHFDQRVMGWVNQIRRLVRTGAAPPADFTDLAFLLHEQRLIKSAAELRVMRKAGEISAEAHIRAMRECRAGRYEYHLEASIQHTFAEHGARFPLITRLWVQALTPACCITPKITRACALVIWCSLTPAVSTRVMQLILPAHFPSADSFPQSNGPSMTWF